MYAYKSKTGYGKNVDTFPSVMLLSLSAIDEFESCSNTSGNLIASTGVAASRTRSCKVSGSLRICTGQEILLLILKKKNSN